MFDVGSLTTFGILLAIGGAVALLRVRVVAERARLSASLGAESRGRALRQAARSVGTAFGAAFGIAVALTVQWRRASTAPFEIAVAWAAGIVYAVAAQSSVCRIAGSLGAVGGWKGSRRLASYLMLLRWLPPLGILLLAAGIHHVLLASAPQTWIGYAATGLGCAMAFGSSPWLGRLLGRDDQPAPDSLVHSACEHLHVDDRPCPPIRVRGTRADGLPPFAMAMSRGRGAAVVLTPALVETFPQDEAVAVVLHEMGHVRLGHLRKRRLGYYGSVVALGAILAVLGWATWPAVAVAYFLLVTSFLPVLWRAQETEADLFAAARLGSGAALAAALRRLSAALWVDTEQPRTGPTDSHPAHPEREATLVAWPTPVPTGRAARTLSILIAAVLVVGGCAIVARPPAGSSPPLLDPTYGVWAFLAAVLARTLLHRRRHAPACAPAPASSASDASR